MLSELVALELELNERSKEELRVVVWAVRAAWAARPVAPVVAGTNVSDSESSGSTPPIHISSNHPSKTQAAKSEPRVTRKHQNHNILNATEVPLSVSICRIRWSKVEVGILQVGRDINA